MYRQLILNFSLIEVSRLLQHHPWQQTVYMCIVAVYNGQLLLLTSYNMLELLQDDNKQHLVILVV